MPASWRPSRGTSDPSYAIDEIVALAGVDRRRHPRSPLATHQAPLAKHRSPRTARHSPPARSSPLTAHRSRLLTTRHSPLLATPCRMTIPPPLLELLASTEAPLPRVLEPTEAAASCDDGARNSARSRHFGREGQDLREAVFFANINLYLRT